MLYKKIFLLFAVISFPVFSAFAVNTITLSPEVHNAYLGEIITLDVFMSSDELINAVSANIVYDPDTLDLVSYRRASEKVSFWIENEDNPYDGSIVFEGLLLDKGWSGEKEKLARVVFKAKKNVMTNVGIENAALHAYDGTGKNILDIATHTDISITAGDIRNEYMYEYTGLPDVEEIVATDVLYADDYSRDFHVRYLFPWWAWVFIVISIGLFLWTLFVWGKIKKNIANKKPITK